jgi:hypothetical protein
MTTKYTFTFPSEEERQFGRILERLDPSEYNVLEPIGPVDKENPRRSDRQTIMEMDPEAALTFRMGMKELKIRRERTEEELAAEKERDERNKVKIVIQVPPDQMPGTTKAP